VTPTVTPTSIVVPTCGVLISVGSLGGGVYYYDVDTNISTQLVIPNLTNSPDIAHTTNKLWLVSQGLTGFNEWDLTYTPNLTATYNRFIPNPTGYVPSNGLGAINDTTILAVNNSGLSANIVSVVEINVGETEPIITHKFNLNPNRTITGDFFLTTTGKFIATMSKIPSNPPAYYVSQYDYATGLLEVEIELPGTLSSGFGIFEQNGNFYIGQSTRQNVNGRIFRIDTVFPYALSSAATSGLFIAGSSQVPECLTVDFISPPTPTPTPTLTQTLTSTPSTPTPTLTPTITSTSTPTLTPTSSGAPLCAPTIELISSFISIWRTTTTNETITLPLFNGGTYNFVVDWGDGNIETITSYLNNSHEYAVAGDYTITIDGIIEGWNFNLINESRNKIIEITQWGVLKLGYNIGGYFAGCSNLVLTIVTDTIILDGITDLGNMFGECTSLTTVNNMNNWDVSNVTNMGAMFQGSSSFDQDISGWNVSNVINMNAMFLNAQLFNQDIGNWIVSGVTDMSFMFNNSYDFNQDISDWDVSNVVNMESMFDNAADFNQYLGDWDVSNVQNMSGLFTFSSFDSDISNWNVSNVQFMGYMFNECPFNQPLSNWERTTPDISTVSNVINIDAMFEGAIYFNQDISNWNVSGVLGVNDMRYMFKGASNFNQDLSGWCVTNIPSLPEDFYTNASSWEGLPGTAPQWGSCP
jgi:surface protein